MTMGSFLTVLTGIACVVVLGVLAYGIGGFGTGKITPQMQNKVMRWRIAAQFVAVILVLVTVTVLRGGE